jgi:hypothetical protein
MTGCLAVRADHRITFSQNAADRSHQQPIKFELVINLNATFARYARNMTAPSAHQRSF